jgi:hypothetical protein
VRQFLEETGEAICVVTCRLSECQQRMALGGQHYQAWTLAYLAGHRDMNITKRYVHPQEQTIRAEMEKAREVNSGGCGRTTGTAHSWRGLVRGGRSALTSLAARVFRPTAHAAAGEFRDCHLAAGVFRCVSALTPDSRSGRPTVPGLAPFAE